MKVGYILVGAVAVAAAYGIGVQQSAPVVAESSPPTPPHATQAPPLSGNDQTLPPNHPPIPNEPGMAQQAPAEQAGLTGEVKEVINVPSYTYMRIQTGSSEVWAAVPTSDVKVGDTANVVGAMEMKNFQSKTLNRSFDSIYFGNLGEGAAVAPASPHGKGG